MLDLGARLGSYEIEARLGAGGMGEVYRARDTRLGRDVAIKVLPEGMAHDAERNARFEREAKLLAALNHANIAQLYGLESADGAQFLIMELVEGETLAERIARARLVPEEAFRIAHQIAEGLEAAHEKGIVHRDLKPANIKSTPDGKVKVLDFGLARVLESPTTAANTLSPTLSVLATNAGLILGTAGYMSPEQARGHTTDQRSDVFSFGCILFEMLTGRQTFPGDTITDVIAAVVARDPDWRALPPTLHPRATELLRRCLAKDRKQRWQSIGDVRVELEAILADPHGSTLLGHATRSAAVRHRIVAMLAAASLGALIAGAATYFATRPAPESQPVVRFPIILPADQRLQATPRNILAISADGRRVVYTTNQRLYLRNLDDVQSRPLIGTEQAAAPFFSPDGRWIGFLARDQNKLKKIAITGGAPSDIGESTALELHGPVWNPDNYIYWGRPGSVRRISADGGKAEDVIRLREGEMAHRPQLLPGGDWLLFTITTAFGRDGWDTAQIVVESIASHERHVVIRGGTDGRYLSTGHLLYARGPDLLAAPFDLRTKQAGTGIPVLGDVRRSLNTSAGGADAQAAVANDGSLVYVSGDDGSGDELVLTVVDHAGQQRPVNVPPGAHNSPGLSPSGRHFTFSTNDGREQSIWVGDLTGRDPPRKLTYEGQSSRPLWTPDGDRVLYSSAGRDNSAIYSQRVAGGPAEKVLQLPADIVAQLEGWLPDRLTLIYTARQPGAAGSKGIFMLPPGGKPRLLVAPPASNASVSPDGRWIAYAKSSNGRAEVFIEPLPPNGDMRQITFTGAGNPLWSRDGRQLFMVGIQSRQVLVADIENGLLKGEIRPLPIQGIATPGPRSFDVSADGRSFLVMFPKRAETTDAPAPGRIEVTLNWFEELKARVRAD